MIASDYNNACARNTGNNAARLLKCCKLLHAPNLKIHTSFSAVNIWQSC